MRRRNEPPKANKTDAGNGSKAICRVSNVLRSPSPDPRRSAKYMITRRKLTAKEQEALALRLEEMKSSIQESYDYSFDDWIDNLKNSKQINNNEVEEDSNRALRYFLHFSSPYETWEMLCGRAGIYTVDARSLKALDFQLTVMN
ncbi:MAG: hypothetical protein RL015_1128 [Verrucomicrobiota bacterium]|jgi:hypothetical protein